MNIAEANMAMMDRKIVKSTRTNNEYRLRDGNLLMKTSKGWIPVAFMSSMLVNFLGDEYEVVE